MFPVTNVIGDWNERTAKMCGSNNWRASLVPAAAVIPAPRVYTKAVAVKKLVVEMWDEVYDEFNIQLYIDSPLQFIISIFSRKITFYVIVI